MEHLLSCDILSRLCLKDKTEGDAWTPRSITFLSDPWNAAFLHIRQLARLQRSSAFQAGLGCLLWSLPQNMSLNNWGQGKRKEAAIWRNVEK